MSFANMGQNRRGGLLGSTQLLHPDESSETTKISVDGPGRECGIEGARLDSRRSRTAVILFPVSNSGGTSGSRS